LGKPSNVRLWWKWLTVTTTSLVHALSFLCAKGLKSTRYQKIWPATVAQLEHLPHRTKVKDLTIAATSNIGENDYTGHQKMASH
jgi:hypothetical protein